MYGLSSRIMSHRVCILSLHFGHRHAFSTRGLPAHCLRSLPCHRSVPRRTYLSGITKWYYGESSETSASVSTTTLESSPEFVIPDPPSSLEAMLQTVPAETLNALGEPTFASLGLTSYFPQIQFLLSSLETMHVDVGMPWWLAILCMGVGVRLLLTPLMYKSLTKGHTNVNALKAMQEAYKLGKIAEKQNDMSEVFRQDRIFKKHMAEALPNFNMNSSSKIFFWKIYRWKLLLPFFQMVSFSAMARVMLRSVEMPVESFQNGGLYWFTDLTCVDPYFVLPLILAGTMSMTIEYGLYERRKIVSSGFDNTQRVDTTFVNVLRCAPLATLILFTNFPACMCLYMASASITAFAQNVFFAHPTVRQRLCIDQGASVRYDGIFNVPDATKPASELMKNKRDDKKRDDVYTLQKPKVLPMKRSIKL